MGGCAHLGVTGPLSARSGPHIDPVEVHTPVGPGPRGDEAVTMLAGRGHWGVGWCQGPPHLRDLGERWGLSCGDPQRRSLGRGLQVTLWGLDGRSPSLTHGTVFSFWMMICRRSLRS